MKKITYFILLFCGLSTFTSCDFIEREDPNCPGTITEHGNFDLFPKSIALMELYKGKKKAYFKDSLGNEEVFDMVYTDIMEPHSVVFNDNCWEDKYSRRVITVEFKHKNEKNLIKIFTAAVVDEEKFTKTLDGFDFFSYNIYKQFVPASYFVIRDSIGKAEMISVTLYGRQYEVNKPGFNYGCYANYYEGLIAMKLIDLGNKYWVFDRME